MNLSPQCFPAGAVRKREILCPVIFEAQEAALLIISHRPFFVKISSFASGFPPGFPSLVHISSALPTLLYSPSVIRGEVSSFSLCLRFFVNSSAFGASSMISASIGVGRLIPGGLPPRAGPPEELYASCAAICFFPFPQWIGPNGNLTGPTIDIPPVRVAVSSCSIARFQLATPSYSLLSF